MSLAALIPAVRTALQTKVAAVTGISGVAPVYDYWRHVTNDLELKTLFKETGGSRMHFWCVAAAVAEPASIWNLNGCDQAKPLKVDIHGYMALNDANATEKTFAGLVALVIDGLLADKNLGGTVIGLDPLPQWVENDHRMMAGVLCHHARVAVSVRAQL